LQLEPQKPDSDGDPTALPGESIVRLPAEPIGRSAAESIDASTAALTVASTSSLPIELTAAESVSSSPIELTAAESASTSPIALAATLPAESAAALAAESAAADLPMTDDCTPILRKVTFRLMPFLFILYILSYLDRINVSFAGLQMNRDLGFSEQTFGLGAGIFFLGYFLFGVPSNLMVQRLGARRWISTIMVIWGSISVAMCLTSNATMFFALRFFLGIAEAGFFPGIILYLTYWFPKREHGTAVARFMTAIPMAGVLGGLVSAKLLEMNGVMGLAGWKWLFIFTGLPSVLLGAAVWFYLCDGPAHCKWLSEEEKARLFRMLHKDHEAAAVDQAGVDQSQPKSAFSALLNVQVWRFALMYFSLTLGMYGFQLWLPQIISGFGGLSNSQTALLTAVPALFQAAGMLVIAHSSDKRGERRFHIAVAATLAAIGLVLSTLVKADVFMAMICLGVAAFGIWGTVGPFWAITTSRLPKASAAAAIALINSVGNLGGFAGPYIIGLIKGQTSQFSYALDALALSLIIAAVLAMTTRERPRVS
jgi:ACS family tartrate transporter-like MFS transporter